MNTGEMEEERVEQVVPEEHIEAHEEAAEVFVWASVALLLLMAVSLGFSAGVMIYVSFVELLPAGGLLLETAYGARAGPWVTALSFLGGMIAIAVIDFLVPTAANPHDAALVEDLRMENPFPDRNRDCAAQRAGRRVCGDPHLLHGLRPALRHRADGNHIGDPVKELIGEGAKGR